MPSENRHQAAPVVYAPSLLLVALAVAAGIVADRMLGGAFLGFGWGVWLALAGLCAIIAITAQLRKLSDYHFVTWLLATMVFVGAAWHHLHWNYVSANDLARFAVETPKPVCVEAVALGRTQWSPPPEPTPLRALPAGPSSEILVEITRLRDGKLWRAASGKCRLTVAGELHGVATGDKLRVFAQFGLNLPKLNPGQYDWAAAERGEGRLTDLYCRSPQCVSVIESAAKSRFRRWLHIAARRCEMRLTRYVGSENSDLALAVLLGARERLDDSTLDAFLRTGTIHLLVVSGLHVGMIAGLVWLVVRTGLVPRRWGVLLTAAVVIIYALIAGGRPPVMRATVLVLLALISLVVGRRFSLTSLLSVAALVVLAYNPSELFRSGTQLSFLCVATLAAYGKFAQQRQSLDPLRRLIMESASWHRKILRGLGRNMGQLTVASLVVWLVASPLVAYHFHIASPIGVVLTPVIWPLVAIALASGLVLCTVGWVLPPVASLLGAICSASLGWTERAVELAREVGAGSFYCAGPQAWWVIVTYAGLAVAVLVTSIRPYWRWQLLALALWIAIGSAVNSVRPDDDRMRCTFLAMGHGTCVVLELPGNQTLLYDAGSLSSPEGASRTIASYLWSQGISRVDAIVLSHADVDHFNAVPGLLERFDVGVVYVSPVMLDPWTTSDKFNAQNFLQSTLKAANVPLREISMNDHLSVIHPGVEIEVLHPPRNGVSGRDNANSVLLLVSYQGKSILLPGDLESPGIEAVMAKRPLDVEILLTPHHGSSHSDPPGFAAWCRPDWSVVSSRRRSVDHQLTAASYQEVGAQVLHTAECGAAQFALSREGVEVSTFRNVPQQSGTSH